MKVKMLREDNRIIWLNGERYGCVTVAPLLGTNGQVSRQVFAVRSFEHGVRIAAFTSLQVARNFAQYLDREFGDVLPKAQTNGLNGCEDEQDTALLDFIDQRADHPSRWWKHRQQMKFRKTG